MGGDTLSGRKKYTNGIISKFCIPGTEPEGFVLGCTDEHRRKASEATLRWYQEHQEEFRARYAEGTELREKIANIGRNVINNLSEEKFAEFRKKVSDSQIKRAQDPEVIRRASEDAKAKWQDEEYRNNVVAGLKEGHKDLYKIHPEYKDKLSAGNKAAWAANKAGILKKQRDTAVQRGSYKKSKLEESWYKSLCEKYGEEDIIRQYSEPRYPFKCDFYIKSEDRFIEINGHWTHGKHPYDPTNSFDQQILREWQEKAKTSKYFQSAIHVWTELDPLKLKTAKDNNLNFEMIY